MKRTDYCVDDEKTYNNKKLIRRRFYLSKESLDFFDALCVTNNESPSVLLDKLIIGLKQRKQQGEWRE